LTEQSSEEAKKPGFRRFADSDEIWRSTQHDMTPLPLSGHSGAIAVPCSIADNYRAFRLIRPAGGTSMAPLRNVAADMESLRPYLRVLARMQIEPGWQAKIDASDIVQQTMWEAHQARGQFRGESDDELRGWLRRIMARNLADEMRKFRREKRDAGLEKSLQAALTESSQCLENCLPAADSRPDQRAMRNEQLSQLAAAIDSLPDDQRQAVILHHLQRQFAAQIAATMGRTEVAVAGLLRRGMKRLRESLKVDSSQSTAQVAGGRRKT
jgi:RNA polymerase sigma-70 factor (ECF subfamily)